MTGFRSRVSAIRPIDACSFESIQLFDGLFQFVDKSRDQFIFLSQIVFVPGNCLRRRTDSSIVTRIDICRGGRRRIRFAVFDKRSGILRIQFWQSRNFPDGSTGTTSAKSQIVRTIGGHDFIFLKLDRYSRSIELSLDARSSRCLERTLPWMSRAMFRKRHTGFSVELVASLATMTDDRFVNEETLQTAYAIGNFVE